MYTEIVKIIEGGLAGDKEKVSNYAMVLAENLERTGDSALSRRIKSLLTGKRAGLVSLGACLSNWARHSYGFSESGS